jgi:tetratricopeptide (TPR) repeat protein
LTVQIKFNCGASAVVLLLAALPALHGQTNKGRPLREATLQDHYDLAESFQAQGNLTQAELQYKLFLADALHRIANGRAQTGEYTQATPLFDQALNLASNHTDWRLDYAKAALAAKDFSKAKLLAQQILGSYSINSKDSQKATVHRIMGRALMGLKENKEAKEQFEAAVALDSSLDNEYALAQVYLALSDTKGAAMHFAEMQAGFGDSAAIHMDFGRAYGEADYPEEAIQEFKKVIAKDDQFPGAHYSLGASYLLRSGDTVFPQAEAEFRKELASHPNDYLSYSQLGYVAMNLRHLPEAVNDLTRAATLNPQSPDNFLLLGSIYADMSRPVDAEDALRKAIAATTDISQNHYQIRGAHYQLGLLLIQRGNVVEGKKEMQIAQDLLLQNRLLDQANMTGRPVTSSPFPKTSAAAQTTKDAVMAKEFEKQLGPAIADSFNNLGAIAAENKEYEAAFGFFEQAAVWNPAMEGLDYNWGRAAFAAKQYRQAALCLDRYLQGHPEDMNARLPLGMSQFMLEDYSGALKALSPIAAQLDTIPLAAYAYAESLVMTGDSSRGISRLRVIGQEHPDLAIVHRAIGEAFARQGKYQEAQEELRTATGLEPANAEAKYNLALTLIALGQKDEALTLLTGIAGPDVKNPDIYYQLGKLQLEHGDAKAAIVNLEAAAKINPGNDAVRRDLAEAYRRDARLDDAARETKQYEIHSVGVNVPGPNQTP